MYATSASHGAIAAADALTIRHLGQRCASGRHEDASEIVKRVPIALGLDMAVRHLSRVLSAKDWIEYSGRDPRPDETTRICDHARQFVEFVGKNLK